jgi:hypothetical protein
MPGLRAEHGSDRGPEGDENVAVRHERERAYRVAVGDDGHAVVAEAGVQAPGGGEPRDPDLIGAAAALPGAAREPPDGGSLALDPDSGRPPAPRLPPGNRDSRSRETFCGWRTEYFGDLRANSWSRPSTPFGPMMLMADMPALAPLPALRRTHRSPAWSIAGLHKVRRLQLHVLSPITQPGHRTLSPVGLTFSWVAAARKPDDGAGPPTGVPEGRRAGWRGRRCQSIASSEPRAAHRSERCSRLSQ